MKNICKICEKEIDLSEKSFFEEEQKCEDCFRKELGELIKQASKIHNLRKKYVKEQLDNYYKKNNKNSLLK